MNLLVWSLAALLLLAAPAAEAQQPKSYFDHLPRAWAIGSIRLMRPLKYREGQVLAYPGQIEELAHARVGKPRTILLVHELIPKDAKPPYAEGDMIFAPIEVLPKHSFWRDNLPKTPHHGILGGQRYVFRGEAAEVAARVTKKFSATVGQGMPERARNQVDVVVDALSAGNDVLREDAARWIGAHKLLWRDLKGDAVAAVAAFIKSDAPVRDRLPVIEAVGRAEINELTPALEELSARDDDVAATALAALARMGQAVGVERLHELATAKSAAVRAYAARQLAQVGGDEGFERARNLLASDDEANVRASAAEGLGASKRPAAVEPLRAAVMRGDEVSRAAARALAAVGSADAIAALRDGVENAPSEGMVGSVLAMAGITESCEDCGAFLLGQHRTHPQEAVRDLIGIALELDTKHEH